MRVLLDAKGLIDVVEHGRPLSLRDFELCLRSCGHQLVLTSTNVREFVSPLMHDRDSLKMRQLLQSIEALPVCYLREGKILHEELIAAQSAFEAQREYSPIAPYVTRWDETIFLGQASTRIIVGYRLDEMIYSLSKERSKALLMPKTHIEWTRENIRRERNITEYDRLTLKQNFISSVSRHLEIGRGYRIHDILLDDLELKRIGRWIYDNPHRCPGLRLHYNTYHELVANVRTYRKTGTC